MKRTIDLRSIHTYHPAVVAERILIITDVGADAATVQKSLEAKGFETVLRAGQVASLDAIETERINLLIVDARVQAVTASSLIKTARKTSRGAVIPILILGTGKEPIKTSADAIAQGADLLFLVDSELHLLVNKCIHYLGEQKAPLEPQTETSPASDSAETASIPTHTEWNELDQLLVSEAKTDLGEFNSQNSQAPDLDLLVSSMVSDFQRERSRGEEEPNGDQRTKDTSSSLNMGLKVGRAIELNQRGVGEVLFAAQQLKLSGRLEIASGGTLRRVFFDQGCAVYIDSSSEDEALVSTLVDEGLLTASQLEEARTQGRTLNLSTEEVLIDTAQVSPEDIQKCLQTHVERRLIELFSLETGESVVIQGGPRPIDPIDLPTPLERLILDGIRRKYGRLRLYRVFGTGSIIPQRGSLERPPFRLTATEETVLSRVDERTTINGLARSTGIGETECLALVYGLCVLKLLKAPENVRSTNHGLALPSSQYAFANPPRTSDTMPGFAELVSRKHRQVLYADYFSVLDVGRDSNKAEIQASFDKLSGLFDPNRVQQESPLRIPVEEIAQVLKDALSVLMSDDWRERYENAIDSDFGVRS